MIITICDKYFDTEKIRNLTITNTSILINTKKNFYTLHYTNKKNIQNTLNYQYFKKLTKKNYKKQSTQ